MANHKYSLSRRDILKGFAAGTLGLSFGREFLARPLVMLRRAARLRKGPLIPETGAAC